MCLIINPDSFGDSSLRDILPQIRQAGFKLVEVSWARLQPEFPNPADRASMLAELLMANNMTLANMRVTDMAAVERESVPKLTAELGEQMRFARTLGLTAVSIRAGERSQQSLEVLADGLRTLIAIAEECDVMIHLANRYGTRVEQIEDLRHVFLEINHPRLRLLVDTGQFHCSAVNPCAVMMEFGDRTGLVRLGDRIGKRAVPLGQGETNIPAIVDQARLFGYTGRWIIDEDLRTSSNAAEQLQQAGAYLHSLSGF